MEEAEADQNIRCSSLRAAGKELHKNQAKNDNTVAEMRIHEGPCLVGQIWRRPKHCGTLCDTVAFFLFGKNCPNID
jgi:hypothetical protein